MVELHPVVCQSFTLLSDLQFFFFLDPLEPTQLECGTFWNVGVGLNASGFQGQWGPTGPVSAPLLLETDEENLEVCFIGSHDSLKYT